MTFKVIDTKTGKEPTSRVIDNIAKKGGLMIMDIDQFFVGEDGSLVLADDCGNITYCDMERFKVVAESGGKNGTDIIVSAIKNGIPYETVTEFADRCRECGKMRKGHWIMSEDGLYRPICDKCGAHPWKGYIPTVEEATEVFKYCPNCGAIMIEPQKCEVNNG